MESDLLAALLRDVGLDLAAHDRDAHAYLYSPEFAARCDALPEAVDAVLLREKLLARWEVRFGEPLTPTHVCRCGEWRVRFFRPRRNGDGLSRFCTFCVTERRGK